MKGQGLSMSMVVTAALAVIVLLLVGVFFSGGFRAMGEKVQDFTADATEGADEKGEQIGNATDELGDWSNVALPMILPGI